MPTIDLAAIAQLSAAVANGTSQLTSLGSIVGLGQEQLAMLQTMDKAIGIAKGAIDPKTMTLSQLAHLSQGLGVDASGAISKLYQTAGPFAGALDVFMGATPQSFASEQGGPIAAFAASATSSALNQLGMAAGLRGNEIALANRLALMSPDERSRNSGQISQALLQMGAERYDRGAEQRRLSIQAEANMAQAAAKRASEAKTLNETAAAASEIAAAQARLLALKAAQDNIAAEQQIAQASATTTKLMEINDRRLREEAEARLLQGLKP